MIAKDGDRKCLEPKKHLYLVGWYAMSRLYYKSSVASQERSGYSTTSIAFLLVLEAMWKPCPVSGLAVPSTSGTVTECAAYWIDCAATQAYAVMATNQQHVGISNELVCKLEEAIPRHSSGAVGSNARIPAWDKHRGAEVSA